MLNPCYVHGTTHVHGYVHACSCMFVHVKFWLPIISTGQCMTNKPYLDVWVSIYGSICKTKKVLAKLNSPKIKISVSFDPMKKPS